jgi:hypothetical protein
LILLVALFVASPASAQSVGDARVAAIRSTLQHALHNVARRDLSDAKFAVAFVDLNGDGVDEAIVYGPEASSAGWCGTGGCGIGVYVRHGSRYRLLSSTSIGWPPVGVLRTKHYGWRDITLLGSGGGISEHRDVLMYNGSRYPFNPSTPPAKPMIGSPPEQIVMKGYRTGIEFLPLYPQPLEAASKANR